MKYIQKVGGGLVHVTITNIGVTYIIRMLVAMTIHFLVGLEPPKVPIH